VYAGQLVSSSSSIVIIPLIDPASLSQNNRSVTVVGFMQAFINSVQASGGFQQFFGDINITVLNIAGCAGGINSNPAVIGGSGTSPVPVRLITPPPF
jgi:hypothetical protein